MIKEILRVERNGQSVFPSAASAASAKTRAAGTAPWAATALCATGYLRHAATNRWTATAPACFAATPFVRGGCTRATALRRSCATSFTAPTERAADAHTYAHRTRTVTVIPRDNLSA